MARRYHKCPACDKVSYFREDEPSVCRGCGLGAPDEALAADAAHAQPHPTPGDEADPPAGTTQDDWTPAPASEATPEARQPAPAGPMVAVGIGSLALAVAALASVWVIPLAALLAIGAVVAGIFALASSDDEEPVARVLGILGIVVGGLVLAFTFMAWMQPCFPWGCDVTVQSGGGHGAPEGGSGGGQHGGGGGGGGSSGGGGGGGGGSSGGGGGGGAAPDVDTGVDAAAPGLWWVFAALAGIAGGLRRRR